MVMKNAKAIVSILMLMVCVLSINAQRRVTKWYPKHGTVVTTVQRPQVIVHKEIAYHFSNGVWYKPNGNRFVVCAAPLGVAVRSLPRGRTKVRVNGRKLYRFNGVFYKKQGSYFIVVNA
jgi:hypothetical protein